MYVMEQKELKIKSTMDASVQPSLFYAASKRGRPLLVGLHTWSYNRFNQIENMLPYAKELDFNLLLPEFRGENLLSNPDAYKACGSVYAQQDIKDAIDYVIENEGIDKENIFLLGLSGGGHMALLMASLCPELFKAIGAYVPITDLTAWIKENTAYTKHVMACCSNSLRELEMRSPINFTDKIARANVKLFHGKFDRVVPVSHSIRFYNKISEEYPSARIFLDIFDGGHEIDMKAAMHWLLSQYGANNNSKVTG